MFFRLFGLFPALPDFVGVSSSDGSAPTVVVGLVMVVVLVYGSSLLERKSGEKICPSTEGGKQVFLI